MSDPSEIEAALSLIAERGLSHLHCGWFDANGTLRTKKYAARHMKKGFTEGIPFIAVPSGIGPDNEIVPTNAYLQPDRGYANGSVLLDAASIRDVPFTDPPGLLLLGQSSTAGGRRLRTLAVGGGAGASLRAGVRTVWRLRDGKRGAAGNPGFHDIETRRRGYGEDGVQQYVLLRRAGRRRSVSRRAAGGLRPGGHRSRYPAPGVSGHARGSACAATGYAHGRRCGPLPGGCQAGRAAPWQAGFFHGATPWRSAGVRGTHEHLPAAS